MLIGQVFLIWAPPTDMPSQGFWWADVHLSRYRQGVNFWIKQHWTFNIWAQWGPIREYWHLGCSCGANQFLQKITLQSWRTVSLFLGSLWEYENIAACFVALENTKFVIIWKKHSWTISENVSQKKFHFF